MKALEVITVNAKISEQEALAAIYGIELATGLCVGVDLNELDWFNLPRGFGNMVIEFAESSFFSTEGRYGDIAKRFLEFRLSKLS